MHIQIIYTIQSGLTILEAFTLQNTHYSAAHRHGWNIPGQSSGVSQEAGRLMRIYVAWPQKRNIQEGQTNFSDCWQLCFPKALPPPGLSHEFTEWQTCITWRHPVVPVEVLHSLPCQDGSSQLTQYSELCRKVILKVSSSVSPLSKNPLASNHRDTADRIQIHSPNCQTVHQPLRQFFASGTVHNQASKNCRIIWNKRKPSSVRKLTQVLAPAPPPIVFMHFFQCVRSIKTEQRVPPHNKGFLAHCLFGLMHHTFFAVWGSALWMIYSSQSLVIWV